MNFNRKMHSDGTENDEAIAWSLTEDDQFHYIQLEKDAEVALISQIEEIILSEDRRNKETTESIDDQLERTYSALTNVLQPTEETSLISRIIGLITAIKTRYTECVTRNQILINQIQKLAVQLLPQLIAFKSLGKTGASQASKAIVAMGLLANYLDGQIPFDEAKQVLNNLVQLKNDSNSWLQFLEQLAYLLIAVTVPSLTQMAIGKMMQSVESCK